MDIDPEVTRFGSKRFHICKSIPVIVTQHLNRRFLYQCAVLTPVQTYLVGVFVLARYQYRCAVFIHRIAKPINARQGSSCKHMYYPGTGIVLIKDNYLVVEFIRDHISVPHPHNV